MDPAIVDDIDAVDLAKEFRIPTPTVWVNPTLRFSDIFSKRLGVSNQFLRTYYSSFLH